MFILQVILASGLNIKIDRFKLNDFLRFSKGDPKALTRFILREIVGEEELSKLNATTLSKDVFDATESKFI